MFVGEVFWLQELRYTQVFLSHVEGSLEALLALHAPAGGQIDLIRFSFMNDVTEYRPVVKGV